MYLTAFPYNVFQKDEVMYKDVIQTIKLNDFVPFCNRKKNQLSRTYKLIINTYWTQMCSMGLQFFILVYEYRMQVLL